MTTRWHIEWVPLMGPKGPKKGPIELYNQFHNQIIYKGETTVPINIILFKKIQNYYILGLQRSLILSHSSNNGNILK